MLIRVYSCLIVNLKRTHMGDPQRRHHDEIEHSLGVAFEWDWLCVRRVVIAQSGLVSL